MSPLELNLRTDDKELMDELKAQNFKGITFSTRHFTTDSMPTEIREFICTHAITIFDAAAGTLLASWLENRFKKKPARKTTINGIDVSKNSGQITIIINKFIQQNNTDENDKKN